MASDPLTTDLSEIRERCEKDDMQRVVMNLISYDETGHAQEAGECMKDRAELLAMIDRLTAERDAQAARIEVLEKALDQIATQRFCPCETDEATIARAALTPPREPRP